MLYSYIAIEGNIGAGKTTLAKKFSEKIQAKIVLEEFAENPFLPKFYNEPDKYAFQLELSFLAERYQQLIKDLSNRNLFYQVIISDYIIHKSRIFARTNLDPATFKLYNQLYQLIIKTMPKPELIIYLNNDSDKLLSNISKRGRDFEQEIKAEYLNKLHNNYISFFKQNRGLRVLIVNANELDFVANEAHFDFLFDLLNQAHPKGLTSINM
ncbi:MAG: deoxynucleoside kinase [Flavobacteriales bacterium]